MGRSCVLAIVPYFSPRIGGGETHLYQLAELLAERGHSLSVLTQRLLGTPEYEHRNAFDVYRFGDASSAQGRIHAYQDMIAYVKNGIFEQTVIYQYLSVGEEFPSNLMCEILAAARGKGIPRVIRIPSSNRLHEFSKIYPEYLPEIQQVDCVIALNPEIKSELLYHGISQDKIVYIANGVNTELFKPVTGFQRNSLRKKFNLPENITVFVCPARFAPKKKLPDLVQIWKEVSEKNLDDRSSCLLIVGNDHLEARRGVISQQLQSVIETSKITNAYIFDGAPHQQMPEYYQIADCYISLSLQEGMSNALLEAMATGLPVIAPAIGSVKPLIEDGVNGFLFNPGVNTASRDAIIRCLYTPPDQLSCMGKNSRDLICAHYQIQTMAEKFSRLFDQLVFQQITV